MKVVLGIAPLGETLKVATTKLLDGVAAILGPVCQPPAKEFGLMLRDEVRYWRIRNLERIARKARPFIRVTRNGPQLHAHPKIIKEIVEQGSWAEDSQVQEMWAGLIGSSCTKEGKDESNLMFIDILSKLTRGQARLLNHICGASEKFIGQRGVLEAQVMPLSPKEMHAVVRLDDDEQIYLELRHLERLDLIMFGVEPNNRPPATRWVAAPKLFAIELYVRCQGSRLTPAQFFLPPPKSSPRKGSKLL